MSLAALYNNVSDNFQYNANRYMKICFAIVIFFWANNGYSQARDNDCILKEGSYARGYYSGIPDKTMFWYIKSDSTFINFYIDQGRLKSIRKGEWHYLSDCKVSIRYQSMKSSILLNSKVDYEAETKGSPDSIYFCGSIKGSNGKPLAFSTLVLDDNRGQYAKFGAGVGYGFQGIMTDTNGDFKFSVLKNHYFGRLGVAAGADYYPLTINTLPNNNYHTLHITVPMKDYTNDIDITKFNDIPEIYKYHPVKGKGPFKNKEHELLLSFISDNSDILISVLKKARLQQPYLVGPIDEMIDFLQSR